MYNPWQLFWQSLLSRKLRELSLHHVAILCSFSCEVLPGERHPLSSVTHASCPLRKLRIHLILVNVALPNAHENQNKGFLSRPLLIHIIKKLRRQHLLPPQGFLLAVLSHRYPLEERSVAQPGQLSRPRRKEWAFEKSKKHLEHH